MATPIADEPRPLRPVTNVDTILADMTRRGARGTTTEEASYRLSVQVNSYTGRRAELHRRGVVERLAEKRDGQHVYVMPEFVDGRPIAPFVPHRTAAPIWLHDAVDHLDEWLTYADVDADVKRSISSLIEYAKEDL
jgi:hypothetical protein